MRNFISIISILGAIGIAIYLILKAGIATIGYVVGFGVTLFLAFTSGAAIRKMEESPELKGLYEASKKAYGELEAKFLSLKTEFENGKASVAPPVIAPTSGAVSGTTTSIASKVVVQPTATAPRITSEPSPSTSPPSETTPVDIKIPNKLLGPSKNEQTIRGPQIPTQVEIKGKPVEPTPTKKQVVWKPVPSATPMPIQVESPG